MMAIGWKRAAVGDLSPATDDLSFLKLPMLEPSDCLGFWGVELIQRSETGQTHRVCASCSDETCSDSVHNSLGPEEER